MKLVCRVVFVLLCLIVSQQAGIAQSAIITSYAVNGTEGYLLESQLDPVSFPRADFDGDGRSDIVWHHTHGYSAIWLMNEPRGADLRGAGTGWSVKTVGDFDGDRK